MTKGEKRGFEKDEGGSVLSDFEHKKDSAGYN